MPNLSCSVSNCSHNDNCLCNLNSIDVSGGGSKANTCCNNFTESQGFSNCSCSGSPETNIACQAKDCTHNNNCSCDADRVDVCSCGQSCNCHDTECTSFVKK